MCKYFLKKKKKTTINCFIYHQSEALQTGMATENDVAISTSTSRLRGFIKTNLVRFTNSYDVVMNFLSFF